MEFLALDVDRRWCRPLAARCTATSDHVIAALLDAQSGSTRRRLEALCQVGRELRDALRACGSTSLARAGREAALNSKSSTGGRSAPPPAPAAHSPPGSARRARSPRPRSYPTRSPARGGRPPSSRFPPVSSYEQIAGLPLEIESYDARGARVRGARASRGSPPSSACRAAATRASARTSSTTRSTTSPSRTPGPVLDLAGEHTIDSFSELLEGLDLFPEPARARRLARTTAAGRSRAPRSTWRCARPARRCTTRSAASRARSTSSSRCG